MHYRLELILPPVENLEEIIEDILEPWHEDFKDEDHTGKYGFYDWYQIGGRFTGRKLEQALGEDKMKKFRTILVENKVTVSSLQFGKETLNPTSQIELVNKLWNESFPDSPVKTCPLFDNYKETYGDIMKLKELPEGLTASRVAIAALDYEEKDLEIKFMLTDSIYNGSQWQNTTWDKKVSSAIESYKTHFGNAVESYKQKIMPTDDWLCVTIDYHT